MPRSLRASGPPESHRCWEPSVSRTPRLNRQPHFTVIRELCTRNPTQNGSMGYSATPCFVRSNCFCSCCNGRSLLVTDILHQVSNITKQRSYSNRPQYLASTLLISCVNSLARPHATFFYYRISKDGLELSLPS